MPCILTNMSRYVLFGLVGLAPVSRIFLHYYRFWLNRMLAENAIYELLDCQIYQSDEESNPESLRSSLSSDNSNSGVKHNLVRLNKLRYFSSARFTWMCIGFYFACAIIVGIFKQGLRYTYNCSGCVYTYSFPFLIAFTLCGVTLMTLSMWRLRNEPDPLKMRRYVYAKDQFSLRKNIT